MRWASTARIGASTETVPGYFSPAPVLSTTTWSSAPIHPPARSRRAAVRQARPLRAEQQALPGRELAQVGQDLGVVDRDRRAAGVAQRVQDQLVAERRGHVDAERDGPRVLPRLGPPLPRPRTRARSARSRLTAPRPAGAARPPIQPSSRSSSAPCGCRSGPPRRRSGRRSRPAPASRAARRSRTPWSSCPPAGRARAACAASKIEPSEPRQHAADLPAGVADQPVDQVQVGAGGHALRAG